MRVEQLRQRLPPHLQPYVQEQDYSRYTARDQAVWRYLMRQLVARLTHTAHPVYLDGLARTGISVNRIPAIDEMNQCLEKLGWSAIVVDGFIPPAIFMEFQSLRILVIAVAIRHVDHILYTPAPDIVHESAGHAPFLVDVDYAEYLQRFGEVGMKAIATAADHRVYQAVRHVSVVKESPAATPAEVAAAEAALAASLAANPQDSEAALLSRLHWWTVEYGLVGSLDDYRIFGAGLLSSLGESVHCLDNQRVPKRRLTVDAINTAYDITREQPQLFVTSSCKHLSQVLEEFARQMCATRGGTASLRKAIASGSICTAEYNSGLQVSGRFNRLVTDAVDNPVYIGTVGPSQLAWQGTQLPGHGTGYHAAGFGSPVGLVQDCMQCLSALSVDELKQHGISVGTAVTLQFVSGITVAGLLTDIVRRKHRNLLLSFRDCTVTGAEGDILFDPGWGDYDMAVGSAITSVFGGAADRAELLEFPVLPATGSDRSIADAREQRLYHYYGQVQSWRERNEFNLPAIAELYEQLGKFPAEWLLRLELLELLTDHDSDALADLIRRELETQASATPMVQQAISYGLELVTSAS